MRQEVIAKQETVKQKGTGELIQANIHLGTMSPVKTLLSEAYNNAVVVAVSDVTRKQNRKGAGVRVQHQM